MLNEITNRITNWYYLNGKPTRSQLRDGTIPLPEGIGLNVVEAMLPILNQKEVLLTSRAINEGNTNKSIVVTSDWHIPFHDVKVIDTFINFLKEYQPDELILNGNINDCTSFSTHPKIREIATTIRSAREEREMWFPIAELLRTTLPNSKILYVGSQCHEGWIDKWTSLSPILAEDMNYTIPNWFKLNDFGIDFVDEVYDVNDDGLMLITHGTIARGKGGASAQAELEMSGTNVVISHTHKLSQVYKTTAKDTYVGFESGCMCIRKPWYYLKGRRRMMDWQQGFVNLNFKDNSFGGNCVPVIRDGKDNPYFWIGKEQYR